MIDRPAVASLAIAQTVLNSLDSSLTVARNPGRTEVSELLGFLSPTEWPEALGRIGHYEVLEIVGTGAFGIVLRAMDVALNRVVAVKVLAPQLAASASSRQRFVREARSAAAVRHENVVQVYAVEEQPLPYLVMEFVSGETLQRRLDRTGRLPVSEVVEIGRQIANGLAAAHAIGLIHRDVKPANVFLEEASGSPSTPSIKLLDFGLARAVDDVGMTQSGMIIGTPLYMSPEQARSEPLDHRADLFSLGSVLYAMTTRHSPFRADNTLVTLKRVAEEAPQPIEELAPETPRWLCDLITKLLAKNPSERIQSAREASALLARGDVASSDVAELVRVRTDESDGRTRATSTVARSEVSRLRLRRVVTTTTLAAVLVLGAILLSFKTQNGEVFVELPEGVSPAIAKELTIKMSGKQGVKVVNETSGWTIGAQEGDYDVQLSGAGDRIQVQDNQVTVERNKRAIVKVIWKPNEVARSGVRPQQAPVVVGLPTVPPDAPRRAAEWLRSRPIAMSRR